MAGRLATLGALGAEGTVYGETVLCCHWLLVSVFLFCVCVCVCVSERNWDTTMSQFSPLSLSFVIFRPSCLFLQMLRGYTRERCPLWDITSSTLINQWSETLRWILEALQWKLSQWHSEFLSQSQAVVTRSEAVEPVSRLNRVNPVMSVLSQGWSGGFLKVPACRRNSGMNGALEGSPIMSAETQRVRGGSSIISREGNKSKAAVSSNVHCYAWDVQRQFDNVTGLSKNTRQKM